jgi:hypothetical protein
MSEQVTLTIKRPWHIYAIDGVDVDPGYIAWSPAGSSTIRLPVGEHKIGLEYRSTGVTYSSSNRAGYINENKYTNSRSKSITYEFKPGYTYEAYPDDDSIIGKAKKQSAVVVAFESGVLVGVSRGAVNAVGVDIGLSPLGVILDAGKVAFGLDTSAVLNAGWNQNEKERLPIGVELSLGGMFNMYLNRNAGKAFGIGVGGGYTMDALNSFLPSRRVTYSIAADSVVKDPLLGVWYLRGAIILNRRTKFSLFFDYYLLDTTDKKEISQSSSLTITRVTKNPHNFNSWGIGISGRFM